MVKITVDCCRGAWLLLNFSWACGVLRSCLRLLRESQAAKRMDWVAADRESVRFWVEAVRGWRADWVLETAVEGAP